MATLVKPLFNFKFKWTLVHQMILFLAITLGCVGFLFGFFYTVAAIAVMSAIAFVATFIAWMSRY